MIDKFIQDIIFEICIDDRVKDGTFNPENQEHIEILKEILFKKGFNEEFVLEYTNNVNEGKFPERQAYNRKGYLVTFPSKEYKRDAMKTGKYFDQDPTGLAQKRQKETLDVIKRNKEREAKRRLEGDPEFQPKKLKLPKIEAIPAEEPDENVAGKEEIDTEITPTPKINVPVKKEIPIEEPKIEKPVESEENLENEPVVSNEKPEDHSTSNDGSWVYSPDETRKRAKTLGWHEDDCGNWWKDGLFVALTTKSNYVMPIKNGDRGQAAPWADEVK